jgi:hypothetical protein
VSLAPLPSLKLACPPYCYYSYFPVLRPTEVTDQNFLNNVSIQSVMKVSLRLLYRALWYTIVIRTNKMHTFYINNLIQLYCLRHVSNNQVFILRNTCTCSFISNTSCCIKGKVKCTLVQALRLCTGRTAHRGSRGIALLFHDHGIRKGWGVSVTPWPLFTPEKDLVPILQEAGWTPGPVWTGAENLAPPTGIRFPDRPARSQSLYRLSYLAHIFYSWWILLLCVW